MSVKVARTLQSVRSQMLQVIQPLLANRESLFQRCQPLSYSLARKLLRASYKSHSAYRCWDPVKVRPTLPDSFRHQQTFDLICKVYKDTKNVL